MSHNGKSLIILLPLEPISKQNNCQTNMSRLSKTQSDVLPVGGKNITISKPKQHDTWWCEKRVSPSPHPQGPNVKFILYDTVPVGIEAVGYAAG
jgi:hypothetical protein